MKKLFILFTVFILIFNGNTFLVFAQNDGISDWAKEEVTKALELGFIPEEFQSDYQKYMTREELAVVTSEYIAFRKNMSIEEATNESDYVKYAKEDSDILKEFDDIAESKYFEHIMCAKANRLIRGKGNNIFDPYSLVTREEAAGVLSDTCVMFKGGWKLGNVALEHYYTDYKVISKWAQISVRMVTYFHIMNGNSNKEFLPKGHLTREQCFSVLYRIHVCTTWLQN